MKNESKSRRRKKARRRWFVCEKNGSPVYSPFRAEGTARAIVRSIDGDENKFIYVKRPV